jgi:hypothetical protein
MGALVAALLVVLLAVVLVAGAYVWREGGVFNRAPSPAGQGRSIQQYRTLLGVDSQTVVAAQSNNCATLTDACPTGAAAVIKALQAWLDDLDAAQPPARFIYVDLQMRREIAVAISDLKAAVAAYKAKDQSGMDAAITAAVNERDSLESEVGKVIASTQATAAMYTANVRTDNSILLQCNACGNLASQTPMSCRTGQTPSCAAELIAARLAVETFQGDVIAHFAPDSLAALDIRLQADLLNADTAVAAMASATSAGDQSAFEAGRRAFREALIKVNLDAAAIVNG